MGVVNVTPTPHGVAFFHATHPYRIWTLFVVWPRWWRIGRTRSLWTRAVALGPVAVALTDLRWNPEPLSTGFVF